ncbi:FtsB family cell division protein [Salirhabdus sp. Marseille-P4669]|uniref:FtsB family cell division protein n=1 Tax=Salirhabdus sp. Marseille-P4669 TaxID=2042310 RepID=UPI000C79D1D4|nr:septum formation initiator family protein [Salirhabdus sp. Marseille-P4669]
MAVKNNRVTKLDSAYTRNYDAHQERIKKRKKRLYRRLSLFVVLVVCLFGSLITYHMNQRSTYENKLKEYEQLQQNMDTLQAEEKNLQEEIKLLKDTDYVLQIARKDYFLTKEGEIIFKIPEDESSY